MRLHVPSGWARGDAATVPGFNRPLGVRNASEDLRASVERLPATSPTLLPAGFLQTLKSAPDRPDMVRLASGRDAWRYRFPQADGSVTVLYAAPTTTGIATVACLSPIDAGGCEALASAVTVPRSRALEPGTSAAFYSRLPAAASDLDAARAKGAREFDAATRSTGQAAAAGRLARAHKAAGAALAPLTQEGDGLPTATVSALSATATAYATLARAARARSPERYADAGRALARADADLRRTTTKAAAAASAASTVSQPAGTPMREPAASSSQGIDLWLAVLAVLTVLALLGVAIFLAVRADPVSSRVMASQVIAPAGIDRGAAIVGFAAAAAAAIAAVVVGPIALAIPVVIAVVCSSCASRLPCSRCSSTSGCSRRRRSSSRCQWMPPSPSVCSSPRSAPSAWPPAGSARSPSASPSPSRSSPSAWR